MLVLGLIELGVLFGRKDLPLGYFDLQVPRDPLPPCLSFESIVIDDSAYEMGSFNAYMDTSRDYATWFAESSTGPIIGDVSVSGGRVLEGIIRA